MNVTVLLVVYNCEQFIEECIKSILEQTYKDFELLIINDGSTDKMLDKIQKISDCRIRLFNNKENNYIASLNTGLKHANGKYIARIDGDDLMMPDRLEKQIRAMEKDDDIAVCSSWVQCFGLSERIIGGYNGYVEAPLIQMLRGNIISHPTTMLRKSFLEKYKLLYKEYKYAEDYKLWADIASNEGKFWVIPETLLLYRFSTSQVSYLKAGQQEETSLLIRNEILDFLINQAFCHEVSIKQLYDQLLSFNEKGEITAELIFHIFFEILSLKNSRQHESPENA